MLKKRQTQFLIIFIACREGIGDSVEQVTEREHKVATDIAQMKADLQAAQEAAHQAESMAENKVKEAVSDKQKEIDDWCSGSGT